MKELRCHCQPITPQHLVGLENPISENVRAQSANQLNLMQALRGKSCTQLGVIVIYVAEGVCQSAACIHTMCGTASLLECASVCVISRLCSA